MRKSILIVLAILCLNACGNTGQTHKTECPKTLDEVEFFYMEKGKNIIHIDKNCSKGACVYWDVDIESLGSYEGYLCGKCFPEEFIREIRERNESK